MHDATHPDDGRTADEHARSAPEIDESRRRPPAASDDPMLVSRVERYEDAPDQCTIHPADADEETLLTTWISADADGYVSLDSMR